MGRHRHVPGQAEVVEAIEQHRERAVHLLAGQGGTDAEVGAEPERHMVASVGTGDVEAVRFVEHSRIAIGCVRQRTQRGVTIAGRRSVR